MPSTLDDWVPGKFKDSEFICSNRVWSVPFRDIGKSDLQDFVNAFIRKL